MFLESGARDTPNEEVSTPDPDSTTTDSIDVEDERGKKIGVIPLAVVVFYGVSGGPFGVEACVHSAGALFTLLGFAIMPLVWSLPEALITAELGSTFPEASGGVVWVEKAFGKTAGWMAGYLHWVSGVTDNAIYPILFLAYLQGISPSANEINSFFRFILLAGTSIILAYINWLGLPVVGNLSVAICLISMSPFIILSLIGAFKVEPKRWFQMPSEDVADDDTGGGFFPNASLGGILLRPYLNNLFWNLNSFDSAATFAEEINNPGQELPRAMCWSVVMVAAGYFIPLLVALGASNATQHEWVDGFFSQVASDVVGPWLGAWTVFSAGISNFALFQAELSSDAFQLMGMAKRGYLPAIFSIRSRNGTPTYGILLGTMIIIILSVLDLMGLIECLNFNYAIALLMEFGAFVKLRISANDVHRPYKIPLGTTGCIAMLVPAFAAILIVLGLATYTTYVFSILANLVGIIIYIKRHKDISSDICPRSEYSSVEVDPSVFESTLDRELVIIS